MAHTIDINIPQNLPKKEVERGKNYVVEEAHGCNPRLRPCPPPSDEELDRLKKEYEAKITEASKAIHEAELARDALVQKALELDGVAQQGTNPDTSLTIVDDKIGNKLSISNDNVMGRLAALLSKMGTPALGQAATLFSAIAEIASSIDFEPVEEAIAGLDEKIGTSTDASTVASLFGRLAALIGSLGTPTSLLDDSVQARLASLLAKAGTPAFGQASTLFGAIAQVASSIDFSTLAKQGEYPEASLSSLTDDIDETRNDILDKFDDVEDKIGSPTDTTGELTIFGKIAVVLSAVNVLSADAATALQNLLYLGTFTSRYNVAFSNLTQMPKYLTGSQGDYTYDGMTYLVEQMDVFYAWKKGNTRYVTHSNNPTTVGTNIYIVIDAMDTLQLYDEVTAVSGSIIGGGGGGGDELLENFFGITEATEYTPATSQEIEDELEDMWELVTGEPAPHTDESESETENEIPDMSDSPSVTPH